jgi:hypothetical protein
VIINALDEVQERQLEEGEVQRSQRPKARPLVSYDRDYRFRARDPTEVVREAMNQRSLRTWIAGPAATAASELEARGDGSHKHLSLKETLAALTTTDAWRLCCPCSRPCLPSRSWVPNDLRTSWLKLN